MNVPLSSSVRRALWGVAALIPVIYCFFAILQEKPSYRLDQAALSTSVDTTITQLHVYQFDEKGQLTHQLYTPELQHIPINNTHQLTAPSILIKQPLEADWRITAKHAEAIHGGEKITFTGNVTVHQQVKENHLNTEELTYFSQQKLATSNTYVLFTQPGTKVHSKGMRADLEKNHIQLLSQPHASFERDHA